MLRIGKQWWIKRDWKEIPVIYPFLFDVIGWVFWITIQWFPTEAFAEVLCTADNYGGFVKDPKSCENFYYCDQSGKATLVYCPEGMWFNSKKRICDLPTSVKCVIEETEPKEEEEDVRCPLVDTNFVTFVASKFSCRRYFLCYHGKPFKQECIAELHWSKQKNRCDFPAKSKCTAEPPQPKCPQNGQMLRPHPTECDYFYFCINGYASLQQCPFYHHWDVESRSCQWKNRARCVNDPENVKFKSRPKTSNKKKIRV